MHESFSVVADSDGGHWGGRATAVARSGTTATTEEHATIQTFFFFKPRPRAPASGVSFDSFQSGAEAGGWEVQRCDSHELHGIPLVYI